MKIIICWIKNLIVIYCNNNKTINFKIVPIIYNKVSMDQR